MPEQMASLLICHIISWQILTDDIWSFYDYGLPSSPGFESRRSQILSVEALCSEECKCCLEKLMAPNRTLQREFHLGLLNLYFLVKN